MDANTLIVLSPVIAACGVLALALPLLKRWRLQRAQRARSIRRWRASGRKPMAQQHRQHRRRHRPGVRPMPDARTAPR